MEVRLPSEPLSARVVGLGGYSECGRFDEQFRRQLTIKMAVFCGGPTADARRLSGGLKEYLRE